MHVKSLGKLLTVALGFCSVSIVGWAYSSWAQNRALHSEIHFLWDSRVYPILFVGAKLNLENAPSLAKLGERTSERNARSSSKLLIVSSDRCPFSQQTIESWKTLIESISPARTDVTLVTLNGTDLLGPLAERLEASDFSYSVQQVRDNQFFGLLTGLNSTPVTVALSRDSRINAIASGVLTDAEVNILSQALNQESQSGSRTTEIKEMLGGLDNSNH